MTLHRVTCSTCSKGAFAEPFRRCYVHEEDDGTIDHDVTVPVRVAFDGGGGPWPALDTGDRWNGWLVIDVTPEVRDQIAAWCEVECDPYDSAPIAPELRATPVDPDSGYVRLSHGLTFTEVSEEPTDV